MIQNKLLPMILLQRILNKGHMDKNDKMTKTEGNDNNTYAVFLQYQVLKAPERIKHDE